MRLSEEFEQTKKELKKEAKRNKEIIEFLNKVNFENPLQPLEILDKMIELDKKHGINHKDLYSLFH